MAVSTAERLRAHRQVFILAQQLGCTPKEAEIELKARTARAEWEKTRDRLEAKMAAPLRARLGASAEPADDRDPQPWMMRN